MTLKEFEALLKEDPVLHQKIKEAKDALKEEDPKSKGIALSKIIQDLGYEVPAYEITLKLIGVQPLDEDELAAVSGGGMKEGVCVADDKIICNAPYERAKNGQCAYDYTDTDCWDLDFCNIGALPYWFKQCVYDYTDTDCWLEDYCDGTAITYI